MAAVLIGPHHQNNNNPSTPILGISSTLYAYDDGTASKFRNVRTKSPDAGRLPKRQKYGIQHTAKV
jgi:hypothetical protein